MKGIHPSVWLIAAIIYVICPFDFDFIPLVGWADDVFVAVMGIRKFTHGMRNLDSQETQVIDVQARQKPAARRIVEQDANLN